MQGRIAIAPIVVVLLLTCGGGHSFGEDQARSPAAVIPHATSRQSFFDYALGKINPKDKDYGAQIKSERKAIVEGTIDDLYFWSNAVTLAFLCCLTTFVLLECRASEKREVIAASLIAQLWNGRVSDRIEIERRTAEFNQLVETHNREVERALSVNAESVRAEEQASSDLKKTVEGLGKRSTKPSATALDKTAARAPATLPDVHDGPEATNTGLQQRHVMLERQVEAMKNTEANLRRRLNDAMAQLDQEKARNQVLKGA